MLRSLRKSAFTLLLTLPTLGEASMICDRILADSALPVHEVVAPAQVDEQQITTERLAIKNFVYEADIPLVASIYSDSDVQNRSGDFVDLRHFYNTENLNIRITEAVERTFRQGLKDLTPATATLSENIHYNFVIYDKKGNVIGTAMLGYALNDLQRLGINTDTDGKWLLISYHLLPEAWGQGYATEAVTGIVEFFRQRFSNSEYQGIVAKVLRSNTSSENVLIKNGFEPMPIYKPSIAEPEYRGYQLRR